MESSASTRIQYLKGTILVAICLQNSGYSLLRRYTLSKEDVSYTEMLLGIEIIKMVVSVILLFNDSSPSCVEGEGVHKLIWLVTHSKKMAILAGFYGIINILGFEALQRIGAGEFTVCAQLKVLSTALCSWFFLGSNLSHGKIRALVLLVLACMLLATATLTTPEKPATPAEPSDDSYQSSFIEQVYGYIAVLLEVLMSGLATVYFEKVIKSQTELVTVWQRNFQLSIYSSLYYVAMIMWDGGFVPSSWGPIVIITTVTGAAGGLLVALTLKYSDSIVKTVSVSGAIVLTAYFGHMLFHGPMNYIIVFGSLIVIIAIANYTFDEGTNAPPATPTPNTAATGGPDKKTDASAKA